ncbi:bifunctional phosphopantothenoylcysteine decarboxylase/phosphopantothenate--cysteine ligase CoaBC [Alkalilimnicola sp. S0819]|uniref:bifunctional phosphopantothenoylcysteine decarboxylase/phosphopantothenate--cysteine ligase CoaBC n=1 Tax=Alkalilimnicola sp. S0819 TaxID=2613922 RepID=UPI0012623C3B|nr:bifunctional phosphopantothenoylcysteine decarboxylase/phosphopantothenate--cysteine ligase CoaBC [Alkalilimnicola sp. S0819]KAB7627374.1 bifunctional phosphopantothenoylcysteine decarboxylase/phosphopantothenate--cysteine ligase CoaBC [Alkalilimnicola sp. S0819]MPQ16092.1 bifunctional phosphopantothenoylcysteine decarboxylase/phosphopantothenate--cysteine ligase CoaBC [Alkalilimnicola sp. S0819]
MSALAERHILLGVTGGIAAYKAADLVRKLREAGARVRVAMTAGAAEFVTPLTFQALSGEPVHQNLLDPDAEAAMGHIELARWADALLIAPASADFMARLAHGHASDLLSTVCLATDAPLFLAPAMNRLMWANAATQANARLLAERGVRLLGPGAGQQACGEVGDGRMLEPPELVAALGAHYAGGALRGRTVLITAGPTREPLDPVRYISNRSSGKMGFALAEAARTAGARVLLVAGPCALATPAGVERIDVETAEQMHRAVMGRVAEADIFIASAAVSDYRAVEAAERKIKKSEDSLALSLRRNPDILRDVAALPAPPFTVGFAAETHELAHYAEGKRRSKKLDMIAANWVGEGRGFDANDNALEVFWEGGRRALAQQPKTQLARELITLITERHEAQY